MMKYFRANPIFTLIDSKLGIRYLYVVFCDDNFYRSKITYQIFNQVALSAGSPFDIHGYSSGHSLQVVMYLNSGL